MSIYQWISIDIWISIIIEQNEQIIDDIQAKLKANSVLNFTKEQSVSQKIPFLDVLVDAGNPQKFETSVYTKPTKTDDCLNYQSDAPEKYKLGVIKTLLSRAWKICSSKEGFEMECARIKKLLVNNQFPNKICDRVIKEFCQKKRSEPDNIQRRHGESNQSVIRDGTERTCGTEERKVDVYYKNQFHANYRLEEKQLRKIIKEHVFQIQVKINLIIYYKSQKLCNKIMKNNLTSQKPQHGQQSHVVYKFICSIGECSSLDNKNEYIGMTTQTLRQRMVGHRNHGSIFAHFRKKHGVNPEVDYLLENCKILYRENNNYQLHVFEALHIRKYRPKLNENVCNFTCLNLNIF